MSDKTFGVKVNEDLYERVKMMIENSGNSSKEWFEKAVALIDVQNLKEGSGDYRQDLSELELHTSRIYELVGNMIKRADYLKMNAIKELEEKLESRDLTITELQGTVKKATEERQQFEDAAKQLEEDKKGLSEQIENARSANENNQALIQQYKEKIDTLSSLVNEYKGYAKENTELKNSFSAEKEQMKEEFSEKERRMISSIEELKDTVRDQAALTDQLQGNLDKTIQDHKKEVEATRVNYDNRLTQLTEKKELEKERAILEIERKYQEKLEKSHEQYNDKIASLYEKLEIKDTPKKKKETTKENK
jgi:chromosome segregation ATPase